MARRSVSSRPRKKAPPSPPELVQQGNASPARATLRARLRQFPALNPAPLRECQIDAVPTIQRLYSQFPGNATFDDEADEHSGYEVSKVAEASRLSVSADQRQDDSATLSLPVTYNPKIPIESFDFVIAPGPAANPSTSSRLSAPPPSSASPSPST